MSMPASLRRSSLMQKGGFAIYEGLVDDSIRNRLLAEAICASINATDCAVPFSDDEEVRGGRPARRFLSAGGDVVQKAFYGAAWLLEFLRGITHPALVPTGERGTYSYYARPGDHLAIHRDVVGCDVAVITCLSDASEPRANGGTLCLYPERLLEPLSVVRATSERGAVKLRLNVGQTLVMYGGIIPHALLPVAARQIRIVSVLCFRLP